MKKIIALILVLAMVMTLAIGCKSKHEDETTPAETTGQQGDISGDSTKPTDQNQEQGPTTPKDPSTTDPTDDEQEYPPTTSSPTDPTDPTEEIEPTFTFLIDGIQFQFDMPLSEMLKHFSLPEQYEGTNVMNIKAYDHIEITMLTPEGGFFFVGVRNDTNETLPLEECLIYSIEVNDENQYLIALRPAFNTVDMNMSMDEIEDTIGFCDYSKEDGPNEAYIWFWRNSPDQDLISIAINYDHKDQFVTHVYVSYDSWKTGDAWLDHDWGNF
jgi:hypothetical protein